MNRIARIGYRISLAAAAVIGSLLILDLDGIDYHPYFKTSYYSETTTRWHDQMATNQLSRGELFAGFGQARLTPSVNALQDEPAQGRFRTLPLAGYGSREGRPAIGVHDDLYVKAVALRVGDQLGVIVGADALIIPREVTDLAMERIGSELKLRREQVYLGATHTHSSLGGWGEGMVAEAFAGGYQAGVRTWFADRIVAAVREALVGMKPSALGFDRFAAPQYVRNRLVGHLGKVDPEFSCLVIQQEEGRLAVVGSYSAHATVLSSKMMEFSGDYPGCWQRAVEQATGGLALFLAGGVGSHSPVPGEGGWSGAERMGQALAKTLLERLPAIALTNQVSCDFLGLRISMPALHARISDGLRLRPWLASRLLPVGQGSYLQVYRVNDSIWVSTPCDFSGELAADLKTLLRTRGCQAVITSFNGDYIGYVIPSRYYHMGGYEPRTMSFYGPTVPDYFQDLIQTMVADVMGK